jgi:tetratricopeptide (TPR) repeat protein
MNKKWISASLLSLTVGLGVSSSAYALDVTTDKDADVALASAVAKIEGGNIDDKPLLQALKIKERKGVPSEIAKALNRLALAQVRMGQAKEGQKNFLRSLELAKKGDVKQLEDLINILDKASQLGFVNRSNNDRLDTYTTTLEVAKRLYPARLDLQAALSHAQACAFLYVSPTDALIWSTKAVDLALQVKGPSRQALLFECYQTLGTAQEALAKHTEAIASLNKALENPSTNRQKDMVYPTLSEAYANSSTLSKAEEIRQVQLAMWEKDPGPSNLTLMNGLSTQVGFYRSHGLNKQAIALMERWYKMSMAFNSSSTDGAERLADMYMEVGRYADAVPLLNLHLRSIDENAKSYGPNYKNYNAAQLLLKLGTCQTKVKNFTEAGKSFERARAIYEPNLLIHFLEPYVLYLQASGKTKEAAVYGKRLQQARIKDRDMCLACGRG